VSRPPWQQRFHAVRYSLPAWARHAPERLAYTSTESGVRQLWSWDRATDVHIRLTDKPTGVSWGVPTPDGDHVVWFNDTAGDEIGRFVVTAFSGGDSAPLAPELEPGWAAGCSLRRERGAVGRADADGFRIVIIEDGRSRIIVDRTRPVAVADLSADAELLALSHTEHGDVLHPVVEVVDPDGGPVADVSDGPGNTIRAAGWSPVRGDARLALVVEHRGRREAEIWDVRQGSRISCDADLPGDIEIEDWWPDGSALLLAHEHQGQRTVLQYDLATRRSEPIPLGAGTVSDARVRPDGALWYVFESSSQPPAVLSRSLTGDAVLLKPRSAPAPQGAPYRSLRYANGEGDEVHAFLALPDGEPPYPLFVDVHGGPHWHVSDTFDAFVQAWVDHGFAVLVPNYRGSTGYGKRWQDALDGDPGRPELVDIRAGRHHLVAQGLADPARVVLGGGSWGGYLTLQGIGTQPGAWSAAVAVVPVADYLAAYEDESPTLQEFDRGLFGGTPDERRDLFRERSPITHVEHVRAPVLIITGANDTRCPKRQVDNYVAALQAHGVPHRYDVYEAGHGSMAVAENVRQQGLAMDFVAEHLGTTPALRSHAPPSVEATEVSDPPSADPLLRTTRT
jgi:dipeptidyl aminopeptidase/acylaminoacyl peptidase